MFVCSVFSPIVPDYSVVSQRALMAGRQK